jgi:diadenosine tetraphosphate (Ap4A) HIT family hydrolase
METFTNISEDKILFKGERFFIINDSFPVSQGHKLIISNELRKDYFDLNQSELIELDEMIYKCKEMIEKDLNPDGYNIGMNCGEAAGQTVFQFHCHVIPRYKGDMKNPKGGVRHCVEGKGYYPVINTKTSLNDSKSTYKKNESEIQPIKSLTREELINKLKSFNAKKEIDRYVVKYGLNNKNCREILDFAFGNSIKRAFHHETPTLRFKNWRYYKSSEKIVTQMNRIQSQKEFDLFIFELAETLVQDWRSYNDDGHPSRMNIGIALKIVNLIMKPLAFSKHTSNLRIIPLLHVPWDKFTLGNLAGIWKEYPPIPHSPTQGFVKDVELYERLHSVISNICVAAGVPRVYYEFWSWDYVHN